jgi:hypothetical protein
LTDLISSIVQSQLFHALMVALVTALIGRALTAPGRVVWAVSHQHYYRVPMVAEDGTFPIVTQQVWFQNVGRAPVHGVEIVLNWNPQHFEIWSPRKFSQSVLPDGRLVVSIPSLAGYEIFTLSMIDTFRDLPIVLNVRSEQGLGKQVPMMPQRIWPTWFLAILGAALLIGVTTVAYLALQGVLAVYSAFAVSSSGSPL